MNTKRESIEKAFFIGFYFYYFQKGENKDISRVKALHKKNP